MSVGIYQGEVANNHYIDFFLSGSCGYSVDRPSSTEPIQYTCARLEKLLDDISIPSDRYVITEIGIVFQSYTYISVYFDHGEDIVMVKLMFEQTGKTVGSITETLKNLDEGITI